jgi:hypothetical protein
VIGAVILLSGLADLVSLYTGSAILFNVFELLQFLLLTWFFYELLYKKRHKFLAAIGVGVYLAIFIFSFLNYGLHVNYSDLWAIGALIILIHTLFYILDIPHMIIERYLDMNLMSNLIFNASIFIYCLVALIVFVLYGSVSKTENFEAFKEFWAIHNAFNIVKNIGFAFAFFYTGKRNVYMTFEQLEKIAQKLKQEDGDL